MPVLDQASGSRTDPEISPEEYSFTTYIINDLAGEGDVFIAGCRKLDQSALSVLGANSKALLEMAMQVKIGRFGGRVRDRVAANFGLITQNLRTLLGQQRVNNR